MPEALILPPAVLAFAATDPSGAGGLQGDVLAIAGMGCYPLSVVTAVGIGDTGGPEEIVGLEAALVQAQARALLEDVPVAAIKVGLLPSLEVVLALAEILSDYAELPMVLVAEGPARDADEGEAEALCSAIAELLLPCARVTVATRRDALALLGSGALRAIEGGAVPAAGGTLLLLGDEGPGPQVVDSLVGEGGVLRTDVHAAGGLGGRHRAAVLGAALAAALARGLALPEAVAQAQRHAAIVCARPLRIGMGAAVPRRCRPCLPTED